MTEPDLDDQFTGPSSPTAATPDPLRHRRPRLPLINQPDGIWGGTTREERWRHSPRRAGGGADV
jgi:hypothetical protein